MVPGVIRDKRKIYNVTFFQKNIFLKKILFKKKIEGTTAL